MSSASIAFARPRRLHVWCLLLLVVPAVLLAHTHLTRSDPAGGARLTAAPTAITLWFSEQPELAFTRLRVTGAGGVDVPLGPASIVDKVAVTASILRPMASGAYVVVWQAGAADGHLTRGKFGFTLLTPAAGPAPPSTPAAPAGAAPAPPASSTAQTPPAGQGNDFVRVGTSAAAASVDQVAVVRWMEFVALLTLGGTAVFALVLLPAQRRRGNVVSDDLLESARRVGQAAAVLAALALALRLYAESVVVNGARDALDAQNLHAILLSTSWGNGWIIGAAGLVVLIIALFLARARPAVGWPLAGLGALALLVYPSLTGHAIAQPAHPVLAVAADLLHVLGASAWLGTLLVIVLVALPSILRREDSERGPAVVSLIRAFNGVALAGVSVVVVTGVIGAALHLTRVADLWSTSYGVALLRKLLVFACVAMVGAYNWRRVTPTLGTADSARRIRRTASLELLVAVIVLALTAVLVGRATPHADTTISSHSSFPWQTRS